MAILELATSSLPIILAFFGVIAILLAVLGRIEGSVKVDISPRRQGILVVIGILLLAIAVFLFLIPIISPPEPPTQANPISTDQPTNPPASTSPAQPQASASPAVTTTVPPIASSIPPTHTIPPPPITLFADDFDGGLSEQWHGDRDLWRVKGQAATSIRCGEISVGDNDWNHYVLGFDFELPPATDGNVQIEFALQDSQSNWAVALLTQAKAGAVSLFKREGSQVTWPRGVPGQVSRVFQSDQANRFELEVEDSYLRVRINDTTVYDVDLAETLAGPIGLRACPSSLNWIDNLVVIEQAN